MLLSTGCTPPAGEPGGTVQIQQPPPPPPPPPLQESVTLALKFVPQESATYKLTTEGQKSVEFEGSLANDTTFRGGHTGDKIEITFTQQTESVDDNGNAIVKVTLNALKYFAQEKDVTVFDFNSSRDQDLSSPFMKLVGQGYTIEITPAGEVTRVVDADDIRAAIRGASSLHRRASALLRTDAIRARHTVGALPVAGKHQLLTGESWSNVKTASFDILGTKSYERIYLLKEVRTTDGRKVAVVEMNGIPTSKTTDQLKADQGANELTKMFDNIEEYSGLLMLDLAAGKVEEYTENLKVEWLIVHPAAGQKADVEPDSLKMAAMRSYSLERVD
jgi:hypothetical protein